MRKLSFLIFLLFLSSNIFSQRSPHGNLSINCSECHQPDSWKVNPLTMKFNHSNTGFSLTGQHKQLECRNCHSNLKFTNTNSDCSSCHQDVHSNSVGKDCSRCHNTGSWVVQNITDIHRFGRFPLIGPHKRLDCKECHAQAEKLNFETLGVNCYTCHAANYQNAKNPDHVASNFSKNCQDCHLLNSPNWSMGGFAHDFFPLVGGHKISNCFKCHTPGKFSELDKNCVTCHKKDYNRTKNPDHIKLKFSTNCTECHTTSPGWKPTTFNHDKIYLLEGAHAKIKDECQKCHSQGYSGTPTECIGCHRSNYEATTNPNHKQLNFSTDCTQCHNQDAWSPATFDHDAKFFPIYSGKHNNQWNQCTDCHTDPNDYAKFSCIDCHEHEKTKTDEEHNGVQGYIYASSQCFACHPDGSKEGSFNHANSNFPLTGAHQAVDCQQCHTNGYAGTPTDCAACHRKDYDSATNPNHQALNVPLDCAQCHTTEPGWTPAKFTIHDNFYVIQGAHVKIRNECADCHNTNDYSRAPTDCVGCHQKDYDNTNNPPHSASGFPTDCTQCHNQDAWQPATFDHDGLYFPIYSGKHNNQWNSCADCHTNQNDYSVFSCITCHEHDKARTDSKHSGVSNYVYKSSACYNCHPNGSGEGDGGGDDKTRRFNKVKKFKRW